MATIKFRFQRTLHLHNSVHGFHMTMINVATKCGNINLLKFISSYAEDEQLHTAIHVASFYSRFEIVAFLASKIENPNRPGFFGWSPLHDAVMHGHIECVKILASKAENPNAPSPNGKTPIQLAVSQNHKEVVKILLQEMLSKLDSEASEAILSTLRWKK